MPAIYHEGSWLGNATDPEVLVKDTVGWTGKNLLKNTATSQTTDGVTFTVNADKSVTVNGTATANPELILLEKTTSNKYAGYILSCGVSNTSGVYMRIRIGNSSTGTYIREITGDNIIIPTLESEQDYYIAIRCVNGTTVNNLTFYPMLRRADIIDDTYEPYHESVENVVEQVYADNGVLGAKNRLKYSSNVYTKTMSGVTFTLNSDNSLSLSGTALENIFFNLVNASDVPKSEAQILSGCPKGGSLTTYTLRWNTGGTNLYDNGDGVVIPANTVLQAIEIRIQSGYNTNGLTFKPMLRLASDPDDTYQPYAMTNRELTEKKINIADLKTVVSASSDFADFKTRIASL